MSGDAAEEHCSLTVSAIDPVAWPGEDAWNLEG
jgi:hypothetical protein